MLGLECKFSVCRVRPSKYIQHINLSRTCPDASRVIVSLASYVSACGTTNRDRSPHLSSAFGVAEPKKSAGFAFDGALLLILLPSAPCRMEVSRLHVLDFAAIVMSRSFFWYPVKARVETIPCIYASICAYSRRALGNNAHGFPDRWFPTTIITTILFCSCITTTMYIPSIRLYTSEEQRQSLKTEYVAKPYGREKQELLQLIFLWVFRVVRFHRFASPIFENK